MAVVDKMRRLGAIAVLALVVLASGAGETAPDTGPAAVIESLHEGILEVMRDGAELGYDARYEKLAPLVDGSHDLAFIARSAVGRRYWSRLDEEQRTAFIDVFRRLSLATYASRFKAYSGEQFELTGTEELPRGDMLVKSTLITGKGEQFEFHYQMRNGETAWRIVNIIVDGVSDLALKRAEYTEVLREQDFDALLTHIAEQIELARANAEG